MGHCPAVMRLFFALHFSPQTQEEFVRVQRRLASFLSEARFPPPENLHLTLAFLGEVPPSRFMEVRAVLRRITPVPLLLRFACVGSFPQKKGALWYAAPDRCPPLLQLQEDLAVCLRQQGFPLEERPFRPHVTLARQGTCPGPAPDSRPLFPVPLEAPCGTVSLLLSHRTFCGAIYQELDRHSP